MTASLAPKVEVVSSALSGQKLPMKMFSLARSAKQFWCVTIPDSMPYRQVFDSAFWNHVARQLSPRDHIIVDAEDGSYNAELIVADCGELYAKVQELRYTEFRDRVEVGEGAQMPRHTIKFAGPHARWRVIRESDKAVLQEGLATKQAAEAWLSHHVKPVAV